MFILYGLFFLGASVSSTPVENTTSQASVTVYYETLCYFSLNFISNQLAPTFLNDEYRPFFKDLTLIPFGIGEVVNSTAHEYTCQHDEVECQGNRFHSCAIQHIKDTKSLLSYLSCLAETVEVGSEEDEVYPVDQCLDKITQDVYSEIMNCYNTEEGWKLMEESANRTKEFFSGGEEFVPYVSFNNEKNDNLAMEATSHFKKVLSQLTGQQGSIPLEESGESEDSEDSEKAEED